MEDLCKIRDVYRAIAEFETQFMQQYNLSLNEGMLIRKASAISPEVSRGVFRSVQSNIPSFSERLYCCINWVSNSAIAR